MSSVVTIKAFVPGQPLDVTVEIYNDGVNESTRDDVSVTISGQLALVTDFGAEEED